MLHVTGLQTGVIPYRWRKGTLEVLLITARNRKRWIIPKGNIDDRLGAEESARREAYEEAGVWGRIPGPMLGWYAAGDRQSACLVQVFPLAVLREAKRWPEGNQRLRRWLPLEEARRCVAEAGLRLLLDQAARLLPTYPSPEAPAAGENRRIRSPRPPDVQ